MIKRKAGQLSSPRHLLQHFYSIQAGIFLLLLLSALSVYGSLLPHAEALEVVFRSWWYGFIFVLTALNLLACTLRRLQQLTRCFGRLGGEQNRATPVALSTYSHRVAIKMPGARQAAQKRATVLLKGSNYHLRTLMLPQGMALMATKGRAGVYGTLVTHLALLVILAGAYYGALTGTANIAFGFPGDKIPVVIEGDPHLLEISDFYIDYREDDTVHQYYSELTVSSESPASPVVAHKTIHVNNPLRYGGKVFYQYSYGWGVETHIYHPPSGTAEQVLLTPGEGYYFAPAGLTVHLLDFYPELDRDDGGLLFSRSPAPHHPHVLFRLLDEQHRPTTPPALLRAIGQTVELSLLEITFTDYRNSTGILISENGGKMYVLAGAIILLVGLFLSFYMRPRQILLLWPPASELANNPPSPLFWSELTIYGWARHDRVGFEAEFHHFIDALAAAGRKMT